MKRIPKQILKLIEQLKEGESSRRFRVRAVLKWFGASRRGANVVSDIKTRLAGLALETVPNLDEAGIDDLIRFSLAAGSGKVVDALGVQVTNGNLHTEDVEAPPPQIETKVANNGPEVP